MLAKWSCNFNITLVVGACFLQSCFRSDDSATLSEIRKSAIKRDENCHPDIDSSQNQFIIGYGSLMQEKSRLRTLPEASDPRPIEVSGFQRGWYYYTPNRVGAQGTYLGVIPKQDSTINAVLFTFNPDNIKNVDKREVTYCRALVPSSQVVSSVSNIKLPEGQYWIYLPQDISIDFPSEKRPIVQSYVDEFLSGCLELEENFKIPDFAKRCIDTTTSWSAHWVNDRIYPRRAFIYNPIASKIDRLLYDEIPGYFEKIRIE